MITDSYLDRLAEIESNNNPYAQNPNSSAKGRFQFVDATAQQYGITADFGTDDYIQQENDAVIRFSQDNYNTLKKALGRAPTEGELYLAHQQGAGGAKSLLSSPNAPAVDVVGRDQVLNNGGTEDMTAQEFADQWISKFDSQPEQQTDDVTVAAQQVIEQLLPGIGGQEGDASMAGQAGDDRLQFSLEEIEAEIARRETIGINDEVPDTKQQYTIDEINAEIARREKEKDDPTYFQRIYLDAQKRSENIQRAKQLAEDYGVGATAILPQAGEAAGLIGDVAFETVATASRAVAPEFTEWLGDTTGKIVTSVMATPPVQFMTKEYGEFKQAHPLLAENIEGTAATAAFVAPIAKAKAAKAGAAKKSADVLKNADDAAMSVPEKVRPSLKINQTERAIKRILRQSDKSYDELLDTLKDSDILTIADIAGDEVQGLTRSLGKMEGAKNVIHGTLTRRSEEAITRVTEALSQKISNVDAYFGNLDDLVAARKAASAPLYKKAFKEGLNIKDKRLDKFLADKRVVKAMDDAKFNYGVRIEAGSKSLETLDGVKKILYDLETASKKAGYVNRADGYKELRQSLVKILDDNVPTYKAARKVFETPSQAIDAQMDGLDFMKLSGEELKRKIKKMQPHEVEAYRIGVRAKLQEIVKKTTDEADPASRIFKDSWKREQLEAIFETKEHFDEFKKLMQDEIKGFKTRNKILYGSRTDYNIASDIGFIDAAADASRRGIIQAAKEKVIESVFESIRSAYRGISKKNAQEVAEILVNREAGIKALEQLLKKQNDFQQRAAISKVIKNHGIHTVIDD